MSRDRVAHRARLELDALMVRISDRARLLPTLAARGSAAERQRWVRRLERREVVSPRFAHGPAPVEPDAKGWVEGARRLTESDCRAPELYLRRLEELELELEMLELLGDEKRIRPLAARRYGDGRESPGSAMEPGSIAERELRGFAEELLESVAPSFEPATIPARSAGSKTLSLEGRALEAARSAGLRIDIVVERNLVANAAAGERTLFVADRRFGAREAHRVVVHEVLGHLVAAANGRSQPLAIFSVGTAGSFEDQEGLCLLLEELSGSMDEARVRTLAGRVVATAAMHEGATFDDVGRELIDRFDFSANEAVPIAERAFRGGGLARDCAYLKGWLRVREAYHRDGLSIDELRSGRLSLDALGMVRELIESGSARRPLYRPVLLPYAPSARTDGSDPSSVGRHLLRCGLSSIGPASRAASSPRRRERASRRPLRASSPP